MPSDRAAWIAPKQSYRKEEATKHTVTLTLMLTLSAAIPGLALAQSGGMKDMGMKGMDMKGMDMKGMDMKGMQMEKKAQSTAHKAMGVVKQVDPTQGTVTLAHEPVKSLNWPAMTMGFTVKDKMLFDKLVVDRKVEVEFMQQGSDYIVTGVK